MKRRNVRRARVRAAVVRSAADAPTNYGTGSGTPPRAGFFFGAMARRLRRRMKTRILGILSSFLILAGCGSAPQKSPAHPAAAPRDVATAAALERALAGAHRSAENR